MTDKKAMRERIAIIVLIGVLVLSIIVGGSLAQVQRRGETENIISSGEIKVKLLNQKTNGENMPELITHIVPGDTLDNVVKVANTCAYDEYIRITLDKIIYETAEESSILDNTKAHFLFNEDDWTYKEGYYYYNKPLKAGETSSALYDGIYLDETINNDYKLAVMDVVITVEAVQSVNNGDIFTAEGWVPVASINKDETSESTTTVDTDEKVTTETEATTI